MFLQVEGACIVASDCIQRRVAGGTHESGCLNAAASVHDAHHRMFQVDAAPYSLDKAVVKYLVEEQDENPAVLVWKHFEGVLECDRNDHVSIFTSMHSCRRPSLGVMPGRAASSIL